MKRYITIVGHMLFWLSVPFTISFFIWVFFFKNIVQIKTQSISYLEMFMDKSNILSNFIIVVIGAFGFYSVYFVIAPKVLQKAKATQIALLTFALFIGTFLFLYSLSFFFPEIDWLSSYVAYPILLFFSAIGALFRVWEYGRIKERENAALERKTLETQLNLLKTQINPHFLFNTINNIDVLIDSNPKIASDYLRKLGDLLRFMLYRVNEEDMIPLTDEIEYLEKYIALQRIRSVNPNFVNFKVAGNPDSVTIAPMIFIVFVENAFKHAGDKKKDNAIEIKIDITGTKLSFKSRNTIKKNRVDKDGGIGLTSVKQRLDLIYGGKYQLDIQSDKDYFETLLQIELL